MLGLKSRPYLLGVALLAVIGLLGWLVIYRCGGPLGCDAQALPNGPVSAEEVKSHPEGHLYYPGAKVYWQIGGAESRNEIEGGSNPAFAGAILTSGDSADTIFSWYRQWLAAHGWQPDEQAIGSTTWKAYAAFKRGNRERFTVAVDDPQLLSGVLGTRVPSDRTVFEIRYQILPSSS